MAISYDAPENDRRRLLVLSTLLKSYDQDALDGDSYIGASVHAEAAAAYTPFNTAMDAISATLTARSTVVDEKNRAFKYLEWGVRDAWESVKRRMRRQDLNKNVLLYYGLPESGEVPKGMPYAEWLLYAKDVIDGDGEAVAAGYAPLLDPSAAEITTLRGAAQASHDAIRPADKAYDNAQTAVADLRDDVDGVLAKVVRDMRYHLSVAEMDKESERRVMRGYGFTFITVGTSPKEAVDEVLAGEEEESNNE